MSHHQEMFGTSSSEREKYVGLLEARPGSIKLLLECTERQIKEQLECGPMPNLMVALPNIGGALCSTPQSLADAHYYGCRAVTLPRRKIR